MTQLISKEIYVYIHVKDGEVVYCGKGSKTTYINGKGDLCCNDRAYMDDKYRKYRVKDVEVFKVKYFSTNQQAFDYEHFLTSWYKKCGQCKYNDNIGCSNSQEVRKNNSGTHHHSFKGMVYCPQLNMIFEGTGDAERKCRDMGIKINYNGVSACINGKRRTHGEYNGERLTWIRLEKQN